MGTNGIKDLIDAQSRFYEKGFTRNLSFRKKQLKNLKNLIKKYEDDILQALYADLRKSVFEGFMSEVGILYSEIRFAERKIRSWSKPKSVPGAWLNLFAKNKIYHEPKGVVLIIAPWNYPFQLLISPLIGAIASGNCVVLKPSEFTPETSRLISRMFSEGFDREYLAVVEGGIDVGEELVKQKFDHIFYTGGVKAGRAILKNAADNIIPVTLELGGKSPCIVDERADIKLAAKRIVWGKFWNAGQTCIAPDYLLVHENIKDVLIDEMIKNIEKCWGVDPSKSKDYARIVNEIHFNRLIRLLSNGKIVVGGQSNINEKYIAPTIIDNVNLESPIMKEEIFGPLFPVIKFKEYKNCVDIIKSNPNPLALYCFSSDKNFCNKIINEVSFGGGCINDIFLQITNPRLPFGGVGNSGMGKTHGKYTFDTFSNYKPIVKGFKINEIWPKYPPYDGNERLLRKIMRGI